MTRMHSPSGILIMRKQLYLSFFFIVILTLGVQPKAEAVDNWEVDGENGNLYLHGTLTEGACTLDMASDWQQVRLGVLNPQKMARPGDQAQQVDFTIKLRNCARSGGDQYNTYTGTSTQDGIQPIVTLSFVGASVRGEPALLQVAGISGIGLLITDPERRAVHLGTRGEPLQLTPGNNILKYAVIPIRTSELLTFGRFRAVVNFEINYD